MTDGEKRYQILRGRLYERLPVLALALGLLDWREADRTGTDGRFFYAPVSFLGQSRENRETAERTLLHSVLHAMLGHIWERGNRAEGKWSLACDMAAEFLRQRLLDRPLEGLYAQAFYACGDGAAYSARSVYARLEGEFPIPQDELREAFRRDSHEYWAAAAQREQRARASGEGLAAVWKRQEG